MRPGTDAWCLAALAAIIPGAHAWPRFTRNKSEQFEARLMDSLERVLGIRVAVRLVEPHSIQRSEGKAKRVIDHRIL